MEREILVANTRTQKKYKLTADVTTLAELKAVLDTKNIDYTGMSFTEGISNVQLNDDSSQLPHDVNYKGQTTNNLVIILTNTTKNIASGAPATRPEAVAYIKANNLGEAIKKHFSRNWTQVSTSDLLAFVNKVELPADEPAATKITKETASEETAPDYEDILDRFGMGEASTPQEEIKHTASPDIARRSLAVDTVLRLLQFYYDEDILSLDDIDDICDDISEYYGL